MDNYDIVFARSAIKELESLEEIYMDKVVAKIESLSVNPRIHGTSKLQGNTNLYRIRVGDYRIIYSINDVEKLVDVVYIRHRKDAYK